MMRETITDEQLKLRCTCGAWSHQHIDGTGASVKAASDCQQFTPATDNRAEGEQDHSPLPWAVADADEDDYQQIFSTVAPHRAVALVTDIDAQGEIDAAFIVKACNEHHQLCSALTKTSELGLGYQKRIEQLEQIIRDQMSVLRDWRGADNVPQGVRDAMAIRLTELRRVVEAQR